MGVRNTTTLLPKRNRNRCLEGKCQNQIVPIRVNITEVSVFGAQDARLADDAARDDQPDRSELLKRNFGNRMNEGDESTENRIRASAGLPHS